MQFRSLILLGFGASLFAGLPAFAAAPLAGASAPDIVEATEVVQVASKAEQDANKKKKNASTQKAGSSKKSAGKPQTAEQKKAAQAKAEKEKAEKARLAKETAEKAKVAKAKADKAKQAAAAKAERDKKIADAKAEREKKAAAAKAEREKKMAAAKVEREKKIAERAKAAEERKIRIAKETEQRKLAREQAAAERRKVADARAREADDRRQSKVRAEQERAAQAAAASEAARKAEISRLASMDVVQKGNNGELRSEASVQAAPKQTGVFAGLFGAKQVQSQSSMLPETRALDAAMEQRAANKPFKVRPEYAPAVVEFSGYKPGTIVIDTAAHRLYLVESSNRARRYAIAVGKDGLQYKGNVKVGDKQEWPRWIPTKDMQKREPRKYGQYADGMPGGGANPLGARAIYLHLNGRDTYLRIHGTTAPETIGTNSSNGCFRMINDHVIDLYRRVPVGTEVVVL